VTRVTVSRLHYGYFVAPDGYPDAGQPLPVSGFAVRHPDGVLLFDTGMSPFEDDVRQRYHPRLRPAIDAIRSAGLEPDQIRLIANSHLHADHAGGNHEFPGVPVYAQQRELAAARQLDYTYPQYVLDYPGARVEAIDGEHEIAHGVRLVPTPGHTTGHQALLVETDDGVLMLAGQASNTTWEFSTSAFAVRLRSDLNDPIGHHPEWMANLRRWGVMRALFAHDLLVWERDPTDLGAPAPG